MSPRKVQIQREFLIHCIEERWIRPVVEDALDEEDLARAELIRELKEDLGANDDSIPIILHLLDQLYYLMTRAEHVGQVRNLNEKTHET